VTAALLSGTTRRPRIGRFLLLCAAASSASLLLASCGMEADEATSTTCAEYAALNPADVPVETTDEQREILQAVLRDRGLDDGIVNVEQAATAVTGSCGISVGGSTSNPDATIGDLARTWEGA
jgi:hypothetical protein